MADENIPLFKVYISKKTKDLVCKVLDSGYIGQGPITDNFEKKLSKHFNNDYVALTNSCTSALELAVHMTKPEEGFGRNDEIIVTPLTCFASISPIIANGARVRWADVNPETCNIDLKDVRRKIGPNTKAVMIVHWGGSPVDLDEIESIKKDYFDAYGKPLVIIEDCAHCWDSKYKGKLIGNSGNYCCFSCQAIKFLTMADGGFIISPNATSHKRAKLLRWFGLNRDAGASFRCVQDIEESGFKYQTNDVLSAIGLCNLADMKKNVNIHKSNAKYYNKELQEVAGIKLLKETEGAESSYWLYTMKVERREEFVKHLENQGIAASPVHARCDKHSCVKEYRSFLPGMDELQNNHISIPVGWWVTKENREYIVETIKKGW